jgi:hypothetical protein
MSNINIQSKIATMINPFFTPSQYRLCPSRTEKIQTEHSCHKTTVT